MEKEILKPFFEFVYSQKLKFFLKVNLLDNHFSLPESEITYLKINKAMDISKDNYIDLIINDNIKLQVSNVEITSLHFDIGREATTQSDIEDRISNFYKDEIRKVTMHIRDNPFDKWTFDFSPNYPSQ